MKGKRRDKGEGAIYQRKSDGLWLARFTPHKGAKIKYLSGKTEREVKKKLKAHKDELSKNDYVEVQKITVQEYMNRWFLEVKMNELKPKSIDALEVTLRSQVYPAIGDIQIGGLTPNDIQVMINDLTHKGYAHSTIKKAYMAVNACFKLGIEKEDVVKNPCRGVRLPKNLVRKQDDIKFFTKEEVDLICTEALTQYSNGKPKYRLGHAILVLLYTGMRIGELLGLRWADIDFNSKTVYVRKNVVVVKNRDSDEDGNDSPKWRLLEQDDTKTKASARIVTLNQKAINALKGIQEFNGKFDHVMANSTGNILIPKNFDRMLRSVLIRCDLEPCGAHVLRHTFASMLFKNGVEAKTVSELLGHSDVSVTYNTYIHLVKEQKQQAVDILDTL